MVVFFFQCKVYDLATALFSTLLLTWLARGRLDLYHIVFPLACLNRETAFLLIFVFAAYGMSRMPRSTWIRSIVYQAAVFVVVRGLLIWIFSGSPGDPFWFRPVDNILMYVRTPIVSLAFFSGTGLVLWACLRGWEQKPELLRTAFLVMAPLLIIMYTMFGYTFEIRVFAEIFPVILGLALYPVHQYVQEAIEDRLPSRSLSRRLKYLFTNR